MSIRNYDRFVHIDFGRNPKCIRFWFRRNIYVVEFQIFRHISGCAVADLEECINRKCRKNLLR